MSTRSFSPRGLPRLVLSLLALGWTLFLAAADMDYGLHPVAIAPDTWVLTGRNEDFSTANGGNIVNTGFIVTGAGVVVIDSGPSRTYGEQLRRAIRRITDQPVVLVVNTHHHPDHFLGNQAFPAETLAALAGTVEGIHKEGNSFNDNMYRLAGDWMAGTDVVAPARTLNAGPLQVGRHPIRILALHGHTGADMALFDELSGVLFAGDLVFHDRAPTTPHAALADWQASLKQLEKLPFKVLVPGHGSVTEDAAPIQQTRAWLTWLDGALHEAAEDGLDMTEVLNLPLPAEFRRLAVVQAEYTRSVGHLYPAYEQQALNRIGRKGP